MFEGQEEKGNHNIHLCIIITAHMQGIYKIYIPGEDQQLLIAQLLCAVMDFPAKATTELKPVQWTVRLLKLQTFR